MQVGQITGRLAMPDKAIRVLKFVRLRAALRSRLTRFRFRLRASARLGAGRLLRPTSQHGGPSARNFGVRMPSSASLMSATVTPHVGS